MKILISEVIWDEGIQELRNNGFTVDYDQHLWKNRKELLDKLPQYDALIVRNQTKVNHELLHTGSKLKVIGRLGVGLDNIDIQTAKAKNIKVVFAKNANATSVAEYVFAAILNAARPLHFANEDIRLGNWNRVRFTTTELFQKTVGLIGLGEISHRVAKRANAFGMNVVGYDPFITDYEHILVETGVKKVQNLEDLLRQSDYVSIHVPLNKMTENLISTKELSLMKPDAFIINTSRGGIIDESALVQALKGNTIAGAYLDVLEHEPIDPLNLLLTCGNATITPHIAGLTNESQIRTSLIVAKEMVKLLRGEPSLCTA